MKKFGSIITMLAFCSLALAMENGPETIFGYVNSQCEKADGYAFKQATPIMIPAVSGEHKDGIYTTHDGMHKTLLAIEIGSAIKSALKDHESCHDNQEKQKALERSFLEIATKLENRVLALSKTDKLEAQFFDSIKLMKKLAANIGNYSFRMYDDRSAGCPRGVMPKSMCFAECAMAAPLSVTTGGAKDIGKFRKIVERGSVPGLSDFPMEGFLSEFKLSLGVSQGSDYLVMLPNSAIDVLKKKLFIDLGVSTSVTRETFKRKPLNLTIVLDISGSMSADDGTGKSRLEWSKSMIDQTLDNLTANDFLSLVIFDDKVETILLPQLVVDKAAIKAKYEALKPRDYTNLFAAMKQGFELALQNKSPKFENRVILISDAGWNTGNTDDTALLRMITNFAADSIGLTALGLGDNFNQQLIHHITMSRGGNYLFVQSGKEMAKFFAEFDFLVSPVAYGFKAFIDTNTKRAKLANVYGIPMSENEPLGNIMDIQTLFFTGSGGGAMVLEYDLMDQQ